MISVILIIREKSILLLNYLLVVFVFYFPIASMYSQENIDFLHDSTNILIYLALILGFHLKKIQYLLQNKLFLSILIISILILFSLKFTVPDITSFYANPILYNNFFKSYFLLPFLIIIFILKKEFIPVLINTFLLSMCINEVISYGIYFGLWDTWAGSHSNPVPFHINHITYSTYVGFALLLSFYKLFHISNRYLQFLYLFFFIIMLINLFLSSGRTGQMSLFITALILTIIYFKTDIRKILTAFSLLFITFIIMYNLINTFHKRIDQMFINTIDVISNQKYDSSFGTRIVSFSTIPYLINKDNIIFGVGMGNKPEYIRSTLKENYPYRLINFDQHGYLHNSHVEMLVSNGVLGLIVYLAMFYYLIKIRIKDSLIKYVSYMTSFYFFCYGLTSDIFFFHHVLLLFSVLIGIVIVQSYVEYLEESYDI